MRGLDFPGEGCFDITVDVTLVRSHSKKLPEITGYNRFVDKATSFDFIEYGFRKLKYTIGLSNFHAYKPEYIKQEIWAKLTAYNITETLVSHAVVSHKETKHEYKINFSIAAHVCRIFSRPKKDPVDVISLLCKELIPIRNERQYKRLDTAHFRKPRYFIYRAP